MRKRIIPYHFSLILLMSAFWLAPSRGMAAEFEIGSASGLTGGSTVTIPVTSKTLLNMMAWQGSINWDNSKLTYQSASTMLSQLAGIQFSPSVAGNTGRLSFIWVDNNLGAKTFPDNTVMFSITFKVVPGASGISNIIFSGNPTSLLASDAGSNALTDVVYSNGNVSFTGTPLAPEFTIGSRTNVTGTTVSLPVTTRNFLQLLAWQGSVKWNNTKITFQSVGSIHPQFSGLQTSASVSSGNGRLSFLWTDASVVPQTIADNSVLFVINFAVVNGATGFTDVLFDETPTPLVLSSADGNAITDAVYRNGVVSFPGASLSPEFILGSAFNISSTTVGIPVYCKNFQNILSLQGSINWDTSKLTFNSIAPATSPLDGILFNATLVGDTGALSYLWTDGSLTQRTLPDSTKLFTIIMNVVAKSGFSDLVFSGKPTRQLVSSNATSAMSPVSYLNGIVTLTANICYGGSTTVTSSITGLGFLWQESINDGPFENLTDNATYSGTNTRTLMLNSLPAGFAGRKYRCLVNGFSSEVFTMRFNYIWSGGGTTEWEKGSNWSCAIPDANADVIVPSGNVIITSNAVCKSLTLGPGAVITVKAPYSLVIIEQ